VGQSAFDPQKMNFASSDGSEQGVADSVSEVAPNLSIKVLEECHTRSYRHYLGECYNEETKCQLDIKKYVNINECNTNYLQESLESLQRKYLTLQEYILQATSYMDSLKETSKNLNDKIEEYHFVLNFRDTEAFFKEYQEFLIQGTMIELKENNLQPKDEQALIKLIAKLIDLSKEFLPCRFQNLKKSLREIKNNILRFENNLLLSDLISYWRNLAVFEVEQMFAGIILVLC